MARSCRPTPASRCGSTWPCAASVWNFSRAADAVQMLTRAILVVLLDYFAGDFLTAQRTRPSRTPPTSPSPTSSLCSACRPSRPRHRTRPKTRCRCGGEPTPRAAQGRGGRRSHCSSTSARTRVQPSAYALESSPRDTA